MSKILKMLIGTCLVVCILIFTIIFVSMLLDAKYYSASSIDEYLKMEYRFSEKIEDPSTIPEMNHLDDNVKYDCYRVEVKISNLSTQRCYGDPAERMWWSYPVCDVYIPGETEGESSNLFGECVKPGLPGKATVITEVFLFVEPGETEITMSYSPNWDEKEVTCEITLGAG